MTPDVLARLARAADLRPSSSCPPPPYTTETDTSRPKWQSDADKIRILIGECEVQARQNERAGFLIDATEWRELQEAVRRIGSRT